MSLDMMMIIIIDDGDDDHGDHGIITNVDNDSDYNGDVKIRGQV